MYFSLIIPVFNRPDEIAELLQSLVDSSYSSEFEVVIVEDGSTVPCEEVIGRFSNKLNISYWYKQNSGPGDSRNFGMRKATGDYFLIFDSDCIIPVDYLSIVSLALETDFSDCFGGPDNALDSFSDIQKAINFSMTSFLTTGGIRGASERIGKFQPRSFNMGLSRQAFLASGGFGDIHPGEDPDLSIRLWKLGFGTTLLSGAYVFHKRRIDWTKFYKQVNKFGKARPILNSWYPEYSKWTFYFPTLFSICFVLAAVFAFIGDYLFIILYGIYFAVLFVSALIQTKSILVASWSIVACFLQFFGYGYGFLISVVKVKFLKIKPQKAFPELFFK